jgi:hypothetical protein
MDPWSFIDDIIERDHNTITEENAELIFQFVQSYQGPFTKEKYIQINTMLGNKHTGKFSSALDIYLHKWLGVPRHSIKDTVEALRLIQENTFNIISIDPTILTQEMIRLVLAGPEKGNRIFLKPELNPELYKSMMPEFLQDPTIFEQIDLTPFLTDEEIIRLGYKQPLSTFYQELREALISSARLYGDRHICIHALCHGTLLKEISPDVYIKRYSSVPLGACEYMAKVDQVKMHNETRFETFEASTVDTILRLRERELGEGDDRAKRAEAIKLISELKKEYLPPSPDPEVAIEEEVDQIMDKVFSTNGEKVKFLDIVTRRGTFNLFSIGDTWTLGHIIDMLKGLLGSNHFSIVMGDYSCSKDETRGPAELVHAGKRKRKRTRTRRKRTRSKRSFL